MLEKALRAAWINFRLNGKEQGLLEHKGFTLSREGTDELADAELRSKEVFEDQKREQEGEKKE